MTISPLLGDHLVKVVRRRKHAMRHDMVAVPMAYHQPLVSRTKVVPILIVTNHSSVAVPTVLLQLKATITKDAKHHVKKQS